MKSLLIYTYIITTALCLPLTVFSQQSNADSLLGVLKGSKEDTGKVKVLNNLSKVTYFKSEYSKSDSFALAAMALAKKLNYKKGMAVAHGNMGNVYQARADFKQSLSEYLQALDIYKELNDKRGIGIAYGNIGNIYESQGDYPKALSYELLGLKVDEEMSNKEYMANDYTNIGLIYSDQGNYAEALANHFHSLKIDEEMGNKRGMGDDYGNIGLIYYSEGNYPQALACYLKSLKFEEETGNKRALGIDYGNMGNIYQALGNYPEALKNQLQSLKMKQEIGNKEGIGNAYGNIGNIYFDEGKYEDALKNQMLGLKIDIEVGNKQGMGNSYVNIGEIYDFLGNYPEALKNQFNALVLDEGIKNREGMCYAYTGIGNSLFKQKKFKESAMYYDSALAMSKAIGNKDILMEAYKHYASLDSAIGSFKPAYNHYRMYVVYRDSLKSDETTKRIVSEQMNYEFDKKQAAEKAEQDKKDAIAGAERRKQQIMTASVSVGLILLLVFSGLLFSRFKITQKQKKTIEEQKIIVEEKNKEVLDSIIYAKRLQDAILPPLSIIQEYLPESFVLYKPKDIVAGDFYWMEFIPTHPDSYRALPSGGEGGSFGSFSSPVGRIQEGMILIAAADCTGHGVPGAMVSVVCSNALNRAVKEFRITEPGKILDKVRELVLETFEKSESDIKDGMDISLCCINTETKEIQWSGAYNPLWVIKGVSTEDAGKSSTIEIAPDKQPIGKFDSQKPFSTHQLKLQKGDALYLFTDGYADQFGGVNGKKFKFKQLLETLHSLKSFSMDKQKERLEEILETWKGNLEQVDDILIIGVRV